MMPSMPPSPDFATAPGAKAARRMTRLIKSELRDRKGPGAAAYHRPVRRRGSAVASDLDLDSSLPGNRLRDPNRVPQPFPIVLPLVLVGRCQRIIVTFSAIRWLDEPRQAKPARLSFSLGRRPTPPNGTHAICRWPGRCYVRGGTGTLLSERYFVMNPMPESPTPFWQLASARPRSPVGSAPRLTSRTFGASIAQYCASLILAGGTETIISTLRFFWSDTWSPVFTGGFVSP